MMQQFENEIVLTIIGVHVESLSTFNATTGSNKVAIPRAFNPTCLLLWNLRRTFHTLVVKTYNSVRSSRAFRWGAILFNVYEGLMKINPPTSFALPGSRSLCCFFERLARLFVLLRGRAVAMLLITRRR
jgi:hypothetical protein